MMNMLGQAGQDVAGGNGEDWAMGYCDIEGDVDDSDNGDEYGNFAMNRNDPTTTSAMHWSNSIDQEARYDQQQEDEQDSASCSGYEDDVIFDMEL